MSGVIRIPKTGHLIAGRFRLSEVIGRGGFGIVFKASDSVQGGQPVALKMLLPHILTHTGVVERFTREAKLVMGLSHKNSIEVFDFGVHKATDDAEGLPYIAMEYLEGQTLGDFLKARGRLDPDEALGILTQALGSLAEAHSKGIVHRDIKPENIFLCSPRDGGETIVKVLDFGIAKAIDGDWDEEASKKLTSTGMVAGTAEYMAPEQAAGRIDITPALDVYAMGCIAYQMVVGEVPYRGHSPMAVAIKHISDPVPSLPQHLQGHFLAQAIQRSLTKDPTERFRDAEHFAQSLDTRHMTRMLDLGAHQESNAIDVLGLAPTIPNQPAVSPTALSQEDIPTIETPKASTGRGAYIIAAILALVVLGVVMGTVLFGLLSNNNNPQAAIPPSTKPTEAPITESTNPPRKQKEPQAQGPRPKAQEQPIEAVKITSDIPAKLRLGKKRLGSTPVDLKAGDYENKPIEIMVLAKGGVRERITIDWSIAEVSVDINAIRARNQRQGRNKGGELGDKPVEKAAESPKKAVEKKKPAKKADEAWIGGDKKKPAEKKKPKDTEAWIN